MDAGFRRRRSPRRHPLHIPRSRSPVRHVTERISKALVSFSHQNKRPEELRVSAEGGFMLQNLMDCWASSQGYSRKDVLEAVRLHMFHEDGLSLRFEITTFGGDTMIKVKPQRKSGHGKLQQGLAQGYDPGSVKMEDVEDSLPPSLPQASLEEKLDMPLDALVGRGDRGGGSSSEPFAHREAHCKIEAQGSPASPRPRPRVKKPPVSKDSKASTPPVKVPPKFPQRSSVDTAPLGPSYERPLCEGFEEAPEPPPGKFWTEFDDDGKSWFYYEGPKGKWACLGPGDKVTRVTD
eukprot:Skav218972  [mRNA]  locus=scaffold1532:105729:106604:+ [translate_table: standard]